jgi:hypothetical protein
MEREMTVALNTELDTVRYWDEQREALGFETVWCLDEAKDINTKFLRDRVRRVCYQFYAQNATVEQLLNGTAEMIEVSAFAVDGSVRALWTAAESCYQQAKQHGDWHKFIEDIEARDDGSFELIMGS